MIGNAIEYWEALKKVEHWLEMDLLKVHKKIHSETNNTVLLVTLFTTWYTLQNSKCNNDFKVYLLYDF